MKSEIEKFVLQHATLTRRYFLGCGVAGIAAAVVTLAWFVASGWLQVLTVFVVGFWLSWFLLREGLPPSQILVSASDRRIGLKNILSTRWFSIGEGQLEVGGDKTVLLIDNKRLLLTEGAKREIEHLLQDSSEGDA